MGGAAIQTSVLYGAGPLLARHDGAQRGAHILYAHVAGAGSSAGLRRGQGLRSGRGSGAEPLRGAAPKPRGDRLRRGLRAEGTGAHAGRMGGSGGCADALLGRDQGLRVDRGCIQQYLGGAQHAQRRPQVRRLYSRCGRGPHPLGHILVDGQLRRRDSGRGGLAGARGPLSRGLARGGVGDVHLHLRGAPFDEGAVYRRPYGRRGRRHGLRAVPVGICLPAAVDDIL